MAYVNSWSQLNFDVLSLILDKLTLRDAVRFGTVCHQWHILFKLRRRDLLSSSWLYIMGIDNKAVFYSIADDEYIDILVPEPKMGSRGCIGANNGWLITINEACKLHLLQPLSGVQFELPPIATLPFIEPLDSEGHIVAYYTHWDDYSDRKLMTRTELSYEFCSTASVSIDLTIMIHNKGSGALFFARACDRQWTTLNCPTHQRYGFNDLISYKNMFYSTDMFATVWEWIPCGTTFKPRLIAPSFHYSFGTSEFREFMRDNPRFYEGSCEDPYGCNLSGYPAFFVECDESDEPMLVVYIPILIIKVIRWDKRKRMWKHVENLGDRTVFLGDNQPSHFSADKFSELRKNCIYFSNSGGKVFCFSDKGRGAFWSDDFSTWFTPTIQ